MILFSGETSEQAIIKLKRAADIRMQIQQMSDGGPPASGGGAPGETHILDNQSPFARAPGAGFRR